MSASNVHSRRRLAVVVGSGSVKCAAAIGLWRVLQREGIEVDMVVGCSGGSLYTTALAMGFELDHVEQLTSTLWTREVTKGRHWRSLASVFLPRLFPFDTRFGLIQDRAMLHGLNQAFGERTFADAKVPLHIVATDLTNGDKVVINHGRVVDAIRASISIPYVWPAWQVDGRPLIDGCMSDPLPVGVAMKEGADVIIAMGFESAYARNLDSAMRYAFQLATIHTNHLLKASFAFNNLAHHTEIVPIVPEFDRRIGLYSTRHIPYVIEQGEREAEAQLPYLRQALATAA
jgi:NTE family protein